jgi:hypothetical protein
MGARVGQVVAGDRRHSGGQIDLVEPDRHDRKSLSMIGRNSLAWAVNIRGVALHIFRSGLDDKRSIFILCIRII